MRVVALLFAVVCTGCTVAPAPAPPRECAALPLLQKQPTDEEFREYIQTLAALYAECAAR